MRDIRYSELDITLYQGQLQQFEGCPDLEKRIDEKLAQRDRLAGELSFLEEKRLSPERSAQIQTDIDVCDIELRTLLSQRTFIEVQLAKRQADLVIYKNELATLQESIRDSEENAGVSNSVSESLMPPSVEQDKTLGATM